MKYIYLERVEDQSSLDGKVDPMGIVQAIKLRQYTEML